MARCPFATWHPISGSSGKHIGGPFKIVHHTTEGNSAVGAFAAFAKNRSDPHFTVDALNIYQHLDTDEGARALRNEPGGVQTNRDSAVQIELVGFAHLAKDPKALMNLARLCRWIEEIHAVRRVWPAGPPKPAKNGKDPGGHNRNAEIWNVESGHYGHCHVPENTHWDPAYSAEEATFLMEAKFDDIGKLIAGIPPVIAKTTAAKKTGLVAASPKVEIKSTMPDHHVVPVGIKAYLRDLAFAPATEPPFLETMVKGKGKAQSTKTARRVFSLAPASATDAFDARINVGSVVSFVDGLTAQERDDVLYSVQIAQRGASGAFDRFTQTQSWYQKYIEILENLGWATEQMAFTRYDQSEGEFRMDQAAVKIIAAIATGGQLAVLQESLTALSSLAENDGAIRLFDFHASLEGSGNFQLGSVQKAGNGALSMALGGFYFRSMDEQRRFLFFKWGAKKVNFWTAAQRMTLNADFYAQNRESVRLRLVADASNFIATLSLDAK